MLKVFADNLIQMFGINTSNEGLIYDATKIAIVVVISYIVGILVRRIALPIIRKFTERTEAVWDDYIFSDEVLDALGALVPAVMMNFMATFLFPLANNETPSTWHILGFKLLTVYVIAVSIKLICALIGSIDRIAAEHNKLKNRPLHGVYQMLKLITVFIGVIIIIATIMDKSPVYLITSLGAVATVLMLVFKDSIVGFVAGVQLAANDMLRPGDWITVAKCGADGEVIEVSLTIVKVRNWDNTITTIPPYLLVSDAFQNWRGMSESDGRRMKRSLRIDFDTVQLCSEEKMQELINGGFVLASDEQKPSPNVLLFGRYMERYMSNHPMVNSSMTFMVRQLDPGSDGLPIELYCFCRDKDWVHYEHFQAEVLSHAVSVLPKFGLRVYQRSSSAS